MLRKLTLSAWDDRYEQLRRSGLREPAYGGPLRRHVEREKDFRLEQLQFDNSPAALRLWNFLLTENERLHQARERGEKIVGTMKDLGTRRWVLTPRFVPCARCCRRFRTANIFRAPTC